MTSMSLVPNVDSGRKVKLRIPIPKLLQLFRSGNLHAEDLHALDRRSRDVIRHLLLLACLDVVSPSTDLHAAGTAGRLPALRNAAGRLGEES
jgi:hypothetical protein